MVRQNLPHRDLVAFACAILALAPFACSDPEPPPLAASADPGVLTYCCDPDGPFPQRAGAVQLSHNDEGVFRELYSEQDGNVLVDFSADVPASGTSQILEISECASFDADVVIRPMVMSEEKAGRGSINGFVNCPTAQADGNALAGGSLSVDVTGIVSGTDGANAAPWVWVQMAGTWPPSGLYSWFVRVILRDSSNNVLVDCTTEVHDGVASTYCNVGNESDIEIRNTASGPVFIFKSTGDPVQFEVTSGTAPTAQSGIASETITGAFAVEEDIGPPGATAE